MPVRALGEISVEGARGIGMNRHGGWRSWSGRTIVVVVLAAVYYVALNAVLIHELVDRVHTGQPGSAGTRHGAEAPQETPAGCADLGKIEHDICQAEAKLSRTSATLREQWRERRATHQQHRTAAAQ